LAQHLSETIVTLGAARVLVADREVHAAEQGAEVEREPDERGPEAGTSSGATA
jgi:hypothetical protein